MIHAPRPAARSPRAAQLAALLPLLLLLGVNGQTSPEAGSVLVPPKPTSGFGRALQILPDLTGDTAQEFAVADDQGQIFVYASFGPDAQPLAIIDPPSEADEFAIDLAWIDRPSEPSTLVALGIWQGEAALWVLETQDDGRPSGWSEPRTVRGATAIEAEADLLYVGLPDWRDEESLTGSGAVLAFPLSDLDEGAEPEPWATHPDGVRGVGRHLHISSEVGELWAMSDDEVALGWPLTSPGEEPLVVPARGRALQPWSDDLLLVGDAAEATVAAIHVLDGEWAAVLEGQEASGFGASLGVRKGPDGLLLVGAPGAFSSGALLGFGTQDLPDGLPRHSSFPGWPGSPGDDGERDGQDGDGIGGLDPHDLLDPHSEEGKPTESPWTNTGRPMKRSTSNPHAPDGTLIEMVVDEAAGTELVVDGTLKHTLALRVPAGRGDLGPGLFVDFRQGAKGELGRHWALRGVSSVERRSVSNGPATGHEGDRFLVDGAPLVEITSPTAGLRAFRREVRDQETFLFDPVGDTWLATAAGVSRDFGEIGTSGAVDRQRPRAWGTSPPADGEEITTRWWIARTRDRFQNSVLYDYATNLGTTRPTTIRWGQVDGNNLADPARDFTLDLSWTSEFGRSLPRVVPSADGPQMALRFLLESVEATSAEGARLNRWRFEYETAVPSGVRYLRTIWEDGALVAGTPEAAPRRLRRFHYEHSWAEPLAPGESEGNFAELAARVSMDQKPNFGAAENISLPPVPEDDLWGYDLQEPIVRFARVNHDALPDIVALYVHNSWTSNVGQAPYCADECPDSSCWHDAPGTCLLQSGAPCQQPIKAVVFVAIGDDPSTGSPAFVLDEVAGWGVNQWIEAQALPAGGWPAAMAAASMLDVSGDGMDDLPFGPTAVRSDPNRDWHHGSEAFSPLVHANDLSVGQPPLNRLLADVDGDGSMDLVYPPQAEIHPYDRATALEAWGAWVDEDPEGRAGNYVALRDAWFQSMYDGAERVGGLCVVPPEAAEDGAPRWRVRYGGVGWGQEHEIELPFFGGPLTGRIGGPGMNVPIGAGQSWEPPASWVAQNEDEDTLSFGPPWGLGCAIARPQGGYVQGYWMPASALSRNDVERNPSWLATTGWAWLGQSMRLGDVNGDGCADVHVGLETGPLSEDDERFGLSRTVDLDDLLQHQETLTSSAGNYDYGVYSGLFYGDCTGRYTRAMSFDQEFLFDTQGLEPENYATGVPFQRFRSNNRAEKSCDSLPFNGLALADGCLQDPLASQPWAHPECATPTYLQQVCGTFACATQLAACDGWPTAPSTGDPVSLSGNWIPGSVEREFPLDTPSGDEAFDPLLGYLWTTGAERKPYGLSTTPINAGQWTDIDGDGVREWLSLCPEGDAPAPAAPEALGNIDWAIPADGRATEADGPAAARMAPYRLAFHFPTSRAEFGVQPSASCAERPAISADLPWVGTYRDNPRAPGAMAVPGPDHSSMLLDIDGDGFVDHLEIHAGNITVRRNRRVVPEGALVAITYPFGVAEEPGKHTWSGTSFLFWDYGDPLDHPLLPAPELGLAGVVDGHGYRVFERKGCRMAGGRFLGCQVVLSENHRGALFKEAYTTGEDLPGSKWLSAQYRADGRLEAVDFFLPDPDRLPEPAPLPGDDDNPLWSPVSEESTGQPILSNPSFGIPTSWTPDTAGTRLPERWRTCRVQIPEGPFDGSLVEYLQACASHVSPLDGTSVGIDQLNPVLFQAVWSFPLQAGWLPIHHPWPGGQPLHLNDSAAPWTTRGEEAVLGAVRGVPTARAALGDLSTPEDDIVSVVTWSDQGLHGARAAREVRHAGGELVEDRSLTWASWRNTSTTWTNADGDTRTSSESFDAWGRAKSSTGLDGVTAGLDYDVCGGVVLRDRDLSTDPSPWTSTTMDGACRSVGRADSDGALEATVRDGFGRTVVEAVDPRADQPQMWTWGAIDRTPEHNGDPAHPQEAWSDGDKVRLRFEDSRGRVVRDLTCQLGSALPTGAAGVHAIDIDDFVCAAGTERQTLTIWSDDGLMLAHSSPHTPGLKWVRWARFEYDELRRVTATDQAWAQYPNVLGPLVESQGRREIEYRHDGIRKTNALGSVVEAIHGPLTTTLVHNGTPVEVQGRSADGRPLWNQDGLGRLYETTYDAWLQPEEEVGEPFFGVEFDGTPTLQVPAQQTLFDVAGRPECRQSPDGYLTCVEYDAWGRVAQTTRDGDIVLSQERPAPLEVPQTAGPAVGARTIISTDAVGVESAHHSDSLGRPLGSSWPDGTESIKVWDAQGRITRTVNRDGIYTNWEYDWLPGGYQRVTAHHADASAGFLFLDLFGRMVRSVDRDGVAHDVRYDKWGNAVEEFVGASDAADVGTLYSGLLQVERLFDEEGRVTASCPGGVSSGNVCTEYLYDPRGRVHTWMRGAEAWSLEWNDDGSLATEELITPGMNRLVEYVYDDAGQLIETVVDGISAGVTLYDRMGRAARFEPSVSGLSASWTQYDAHGRVAAEHRPGLAHPKTYTWRDDGSLLAWEDGDGQGASSFFGVVDGWIDYDDAGRPIATTLHDGTTHHRSYEGRRVAAEWSTGSDGAVLSRSDLDWNPVTGQLDARRQAITTGCAALAVGSRLDSACGPDDYTERSFEWSSAGRREGVTDALGNATQWAYDDATGWLMGESSDVLERSWERDSLGRPVLQIDGSPTAPAGIAAWTWDDFGRLEERFWQQGAEDETEETVFDALGRPIWSGVQRNGDWMESVHREFDAFDRVVQQRQELGQTPTFLGANGTCDAGELCFDYDALGRRTGVTWPDGRAVNLTYGDAGLDRVDEIGPGGATLFEVLARDDGGRPLSTWRSGEVFEDVTRDAFGRVTDRAVTQLQSANAGTSGVHESVSYDALGRIQQRRVAPWGGNEASEQYSGYTYNAAGWLTQETTDEAEWVEEHDRVGNRVRREDLVSGEGWAASFGPGNQLVNRSALDGSWSQAFTYDDLGRRSHDGELNALTHSPRGRVESSVSPDGGQQTQWAYGVGGRRIGESADGAERTFTYGPGAWLPWVVGDAAGDRNSLMAGGEPLLTLEPMGLASSPIRGASGGPMLATDQDGATAWSGGYTAWGLTAGSEGVAPVPSWDGMLGTAGTSPILSAGHRDFDRATGQWLQPDPLGVDGDISLYRYAEGDPVNRSDPSGLCAESQWWVYRIGEERRQADMALLDAGLFDLTASSGAPPSNLPGATSTWGVGFDPFEGVGPRCVLCEGGGGPSTEVDFDEDVELTGVIYPAVTHIDFGTDVILTGIISVDPDDADSDLDDLDEPGGYGSAGTGWGPDSPPNGGPPLPEPGGAEPGGPLWDPRNPNPGLGDPHPPSPGFGFEFPGGPEVQFPGAPWEHPEELSSIAVETPQLKFFQRWVLGDDFEANHQRALEGGTPGVDPNHPVNQFTNELTKRSPQASVNAMDVAMGAAPAKSLASAVRKAFGGRKKPPVSSAQTQASKELTEEGLERVARVGDESSTALSPQPDPYHVLNRSHSGSAPRPKGRGPNGGRLQSHHPLQNEWAKNNLPGYRPGMAPSITLETGSGFPHTRISARQNARRDARVAAGEGKWSSSLQEELNYLVADLRAVGFSDDVVSRVLQQTYKMLDTLKVPYTKVKL